jgi:hypothetical protein
MSAMIASKLILQVAVGGVGGFFPDAPDKPWRNSDSDSAMKVCVCTKQ